MGIDEYTQNTVSWRRISALVLAFALIALPAAADSGIQLTATEPVAEISDDPGKESASVPEHAPVGMSQNYETPAGQLIGPAPLPAPRHIFFNVANDAGVKHNLDGAAYGGPNGTYYIKADGGGLNELHITNDAAAPAGQVTAGTDPSGVFWVANTGGRGYHDNVILLVSVNGTIPDDFALHIRSSGYVWAPAPPGEYSPELPSEYQYADGAVDELFSRDDFIYGPQAWKPGPGDLEVPSLPLYYGQEIDDPSAASHLIFVDLNVGNLKNGVYPGAALTDNGGAKVEFAFTNLSTHAAFNAYGWCSASNQGQGISWTNRVAGAESSGYTVAGVPPAPPVAAFSANVTAGDAPLTVRFTDLSTGNPTSWAWDFEDDGVIDSVEQNATFTYAAAGTYTVNLTVANAGGGDSAVKTDLITVTPPPGPTVLPGYNNIFIRVANNAGAKYNAFCNNTYNVMFEGIGRGLNALHVSTDPAANFGQVTVTENQTGTFYATDSGGKGYEDDILLMVAVNGTIPDNFRLRITADGYTWTPNPERNRAPSLDNVAYQPLSLDETFTKADFIYGPQTWKPTGNEADYPLHAGQDMNDAENTFLLMFIDLNAGVLRPNEALVNRGAVRINYDLDNLESFAAFSVYGYCRNPNNGDDVIAWTNALSSDKVMSGYSVIGNAGKPVAAFSADRTGGWAPLSVAFSDLSAGQPTAWSWSFGDGATSTGQHPVHTYEAAGNYAVRLAVTNGKGSDTLVKQGYITVSNVKGDFNGDGTVDIGDVAKVACMVVGKTGTDPAADFNGNGAVDIGDAAKIACYFVGKIATL